MLRFLMRYLLNHPQIIDRMANSYIMRRAAQMTVYMFHRSKAALEDKGAVGFKEKVTKQVKEIMDTDPSLKIKSFKNTFTNEFKKEWEKARGGGSDPPKRN